MKKENYISRLFRQQIADAVSWELIYQIMRRYHVPYDLRIVETHPCSGQYDCISIYSHKEKSLFFDFNLPAQSLHVCRNDDKRYNVVDDYLQAENPKEYLDKICRQAGLTVPDSVPSSTGPVIACGVMAQLLHNKMFSRECYKFYMGYIDSSGMYHGIRKEAMILFDITRRLLDDANDKNISKFYKYFYLEETSSRSIFCLFDMSGRMYFRDNTEINLIEMYNKHDRSIHLLACAVVDKLHKNSIF